MCKKTILEKALSASPCAIKQKYAESILNDLISEELKFGKFWVESFQRLQGASSVSVWKFCYVLHYILFRGFDSCRGKLTGDRKNDLKKLGEDNCCPLVRKYVKFLLVKIEMHEKYPNISGNWKISFPDFEKFIEDNAESSDIIRIMVEVLQLSVDVQETVAKFLEKMSSMSEKVQSCKLHFALSFEESVRIRDLCHHVIFKPQLAPHLEVLKNLDLKLNNECHPAKFTIFLEALPKELQERFRKRANATDVLSEAEDIVVKLKDIYAESEIIIKRLKAMKCGIQSNSMCSGAGEKPKICVKTVCEQKTEPDEISKTLKEIKEQIKSFKVVTEPEEHLDRLKVILAEVEKIAGHSKKTEAEEKMKNSEEMKAELKEIVARAEEILEKLTIAQGLVKAVAAGSVEKLKEMLKRAEEIVKKLKSSEV